MKHLFKTVWTDRSEGKGRGNDEDDAPSYISEWFCPEAEEVAKGLYDGSTRVYTKIDGSCGALIRGEDGRYEIWQRFDDKKNRFQNGEKIEPGYRKLPDVLGVDSGNPSVYRNTGITTHRYYLKHLPRNPEGKFEKRIAKELYGVLDQTIANLDRDFYSVEIVGVNFNRTPGVEGNSIAVHSRQQTTLENLPTCDTSQAGVKALQDYLRVYFTRDVPEGFLNAEGLIFEHQGVYWKVRSDKVTKVAEMKKAYKPPVLL
jgi:hypothetical protein